MAPATRNPALAKKISQMRLKIAPIVSVINGHAHPEFPQTLLQLFLLTEDQLDRLAEYYSQVTPDAYTFLYPKTMRWDPEFLRKPREGDCFRDGEFRLNDLERLQIKMRKFAQFIGMRGAETPMWEVECQLRMLGDRIIRLIEEEEQREKKKWC